MKRLFYVIAAAALLLASANVADAQQRVNSKEIFFKGDFFVGIGGGATVYFGEHDRQMSFHHRIAPAMDVYIGKWIIPCLGLRVSYSGGQAFGLSNSWDGNPHGSINWYPNTDYYWLRWQEFNYFRVHADLMLNVRNLFKTKNPDRIYDIIPYGGIGMAKVYDDLEDTQFGITVGLYNRFRITKSLGVVLDAHATAVPERFDHEEGVRPGRKESGLYAYDGILTASVGIAYSF